MVFVRQSATKQKAMTDTDLIEIQRRAIQAFGRMRKTPIVDDDFPEMRDRADLAARRAERAYAEWCDSNNVKAGGSQICPICDVGTPHFHAREVIDDFYASPCTCVNALYEGNCAVHGLKEKL